jgi:hypothetical protein
MGQAVVEALPNTPASVIAWRILPATTFPGGVSEIIDKVKDDQTWIAVISTCQATWSFACLFTLVVNAGASSRLEASIVNPDPSYNGTEAITVYAAEARNENA